jgi:hypothetical protein
MLKGRGRLEERGYMGWSNKDKESTLARNLILKSCVRI